MVLAETSSNFACVVCSYNLYLIAITLAPTHMYHTYLIAPACTHVTKKPLPPRKLCTCTCTCFPQRRGLNSEPKTCYSHGRGSFVRNKFNYKQLYRICAPEMFHGDYNQLIINNSLLRYFSSCQHFWGLHVPNKGHKAKNWHVLKQSTNELLIIILYIC